MKADTPEFSVNWFLVLEIDLTWGVQVVIKPPEVSPMGTSPPGFSEKYVQSPRKIAGSRPQDVSFHHRLVARYNTEN